MQPRTAVEPLTLQTHTTAADLQVLHELERDAGTRLRFAARALAGERLERLLWFAVDAGVRLRAERLQQQLERLDERLVLRLRARLHRGRYTTAGMRRSLARCARLEPRDQHSTHSYGALDTLLSGVLDAGELPAERVARTHEMVAYQPAAARAIVELMSHVQPTDTFYDLGSGLGRVAILVALLCGARAVGVELEPGFCAYARRSAALVGAQRAEFIEGDAREVSLSAGDVFFLYTPFRGGVLRAVLERLHALSMCKPIVVCSLGPSTAEIAQVRWLTRLRDGAAEPGLAGEELAVFHCS